MAILLFIASSLATFVFFAVCAVAVVVEVHTGRGYGLAILSSLLLLSGLLVLVYVTVSISAETQPIGIHSWSPAILLLVYYVLAIPPMLLVLICAVIVAGIAGQWRWIIGFFAAVLVPVLGVVPHPFLDQGTEIIVQHVGAIGILAVPVVTLLAFSIKRIVRPIVPASARRAAALT